MSDSEYVSCNYCRADNTETLFQVPVLPHQIGRYHQDIWNIVKCLECGLIYENPRPDSQTLADFYSFNNQWDKSFVENWFIENEDLNQSSWQQILRSMSRFQEPGKILDIGCGGGSFLVEAQFAGYDIYGHEVSPYFIEHCINRGLRVFSGPLEKISLENESFDCVTAFDVIEHHPNPDQLLKDMFRLLRKGGLAVISTHDIGSFFSRLYGKKWRHLLPIGHLYYFDRATLTKFMVKNGFTIIHVEGAHTIDGSYTAEKLNYIKKFFKVVILRALILGIYKPVSLLFPGLSNWEFKFRNKTINHQKILFRSGNQIVMNDELVVLAFRSR